MKGIPYRYLLPNFLTLTGLCVGLTGLKIAADGRFEGAAAALLLAALFDALDGRVARLVKGCSHFGAELDSLADFVNFGVFPAFLLYFWQLHHAGSIGWAVVLVYIAACALRLARFNTQSIPDTVEAMQVKTGFTGIPAPAGALSALLPLFYHLAFPEYGMLPPVLIALYLCYVAVLMVSRLPVPALPRLRLQPYYIVPVLLLCTALIGTLGTDPWLTVTLLVAAAQLFFLNLIGRAWMRIRHAL